MSKDQGGYLGSIRQAEDLAAFEPNVFLPSQFSNQSSVEALELTTGPEIWWQPNDKSLQPDAFVSGVGTGGLILGVGRKSGHHRIQGISDWVHSTDREARVPRRHHRHKRRRCHSYGQKTRRRAREIRRNLVGRRTRADEDGNSLP